jgi:hypothetical protein
MDGRVLNFGGHFGEIIWNYGMKLKKSAMKRCLYMERARLVHTHERWDFFY